MVMTTGTIGTVRRILFVTLALGLAGTWAELLLLGHYEDWQQYGPLVLLLLGLVTQGWFVVARSAASIRAIRATMWLCILSGAVGMFFHVRGNMEFELEMVPGMSGWELLRETFTGATPALAPGAMIQLGLLGLAWAFRHPALGRAPDDPRFD
jgi:hypothetical protein